MNMANRPAAAVVQLSGSYCSRSWLSDQHQLVGQISCYSNLGRDSWSSRTGTADVAIYLTSSQLLEQGNGQWSRRSFNYCSRAAIRWFCASAFCKDDFAKTFRQWLYSTGKTDILITLHNGVELKGYKVVKNYTKLMATLLKTPVLNIFFCNVFQLQVIQVPRTNNFHVWRTPIPIWVYFFYLSSLS